MSFKSGWSDVVAPAGARPAILRLVTFETKEIPVKIRPKKVEPEQGGEDFDLTDASGGEFRERDDDDEDREDKWGVAERSIQKCIKELKVLVDEVQDAIIDLNKNENARPHPRGVWIKS